MDEQEQVMDEYAALLKQLRGNPRFKEVLREELIRFLEFQSPDNFSHETYDLTVGWYEDGIKRLKAAML